MMEIYSIGSERNHFAMVDVGFRRGGKKYVSSACCFAAPVFFVNLVSPFERQKALGFTSVPAHAG
jgi:hypothetical protein